ncbi:hypothetical protein BSL78_11522 [Apostichopus japonicus]|uniref:NACHT domain-containing protein n=1 Tax=Stichopus japonicus TaxID=307972 RepID=A0A2G8KUB3_STIJA|nr:hypothetical protein BSL78_11522 [Apostichopus japonicus]
MYVGCTSHFTYGVVRARLVNRAVNSLGESNLEVRREHVLVCLKKNAKAYGLHCNENEYATLGQNFAIDCHVENGSNVYWYSEKTMFGSPLVKLENGEKVVLKPAEGNYDITGTGALLIKGVIEDRCGLYKILSVKDATYEEAFVRLELAIKPQQICLGLSLCDSCHCRSGANAYHNVSCSVLGARPLVNVSLVTGNKDLFNVTVRHNTDTDTFDTIAYMGVSMDTCGSKLSVRCTVVGSNMFGIKDSSMDLNSAPCTQTTDTHTDSTAKDEEVPVFLDGFILVIIVVVSVGIAVMMVVTVCFTVCKKVRNDNSKKEHQESDTELSAIEPLLTHSSPLSEEQMDKLMNYLQDRYQSMSYIKPVPWGEKVLIDELYTETICHVTDRNRPTETKTSNFLLDPTVSPEIKRALFIADIGHGKTTLRQYLACQWSKKELNEKKKEMLFILPMTGIDINAGIGEQLHNTLPEDMNISCEQLCDIILKRKCHLLLDRLDEISQQENTSSTHVVSPGDISIKRLLSESMLSQNQHFRLWVTSRKMDQSKCIYEQPYVKVEILGFNIDEIKTYVGKTLDYYKRIKPCETKTLHNNDLTDASRSKPKEQSTDETNGDLLEKAIYILNQNDLVTAFKDTPLLIVTCIHIIVSKLLQINGAIYELNINKMSSLVSSVITCLDRRFLEKPGNETMISELQPLRMKLAKASLNYYISGSIKNLDLNGARLQAHEIEMAQSIGYIKPIKALQNVDESKPDYNVFSHDYIQDFFIAEYIVSEDLDAFKNILLALKANKTEENIRISRILRFICGISKKMRDETLKHLWTNECWNTLADCIYESDNDEDPPNMETNEESVKPFTLQQKYPHASMKVVRLDERYHQNSFKLFIEKCLRSNVKFEAMSFGADCPLDFLLQLKLPEIEIIELNYINLEQKDGLLMKIVQWAKRNVIAKIRFLGCNVPVKVGAQYRDKETLTKIKRQDQNIQHKLFQAAETQHHATRHEFNLKHYEIVK